MKIALIFVLIALPVFTHAAVVINEVAWMGTANSASDEWLELYSDSAQDLSGWTLATADGGMNIALSGGVAAGGYFLIERTDDTTVPDIAADLVAAFGSGLSNTGEILILKNAAGVEVNRVDASGGWPAGDNSTKETMQKSGGAWVTALATPKAPNAGASQSGGGASSDTTPPSSGGSSPSSAPPSDTPKFTVDAGDDRVAIVGAETRFDGVLYDGAGKPVSGADFIWNFGDGAIARGAAAVHSYRFPGDYTVFLSAAWGGVSLSGRASVTAISNGLAISEVKPAESGWIELSNSSAYDLDISGWGIGNGEMIYSVPLHTEIRRGKRLVITREASGIIFPAAGAAILMYPNGTVADALRYAGALKADESFQRHDGATKIGLESPGSDRFVFRSGLTGQGAPVSSGGAAKKASTEAAALSAADRNAERSTALPIAAQSEKAGSWGWVLWLAAALGIGIAGAAGYLVLSWRGLL